MLEIDAEKIRNLMFQSKLSISDLAKAAGISKTTAARVIRNGAKTTFVIVGKLANAFKVDGNVLILTK